MGYTHGRLACIGCQSFQYENPNSFIFMQMNMSLTSKGLRHIISDYKNAHFPYRADDTWMASQAENGCRNAMLDADLEEEVVGIECYTVAAQGRASLERR
jgi:hypothetical protein